MTRVMRKNHSTAMPNAIVILDTEANEYPCDNGRIETKLVLSFGKARYIRYRKGERCGKEVTTFKSSDEFWQWLLPKLYRKTSTWLFAHNLGFDLTIIGFWDMLESRVLSLLNPAAKCTVDADGQVKERKQTKLYVDGDPPTIVRAYTEHGGQLLMVDTLNYWPVPLAELGRLQGMPKLPMPDVWSPAKAWDEYCDRDCDILENAVTSLIDFVSTNDYGRFRWTAPSQAMAAYRHRLGNTNIDFDRPKPAIEVERQAYFGGRVEVLYTGEINEEVFELDVSSMYPSVMRDNYFPREFRNSHETKGAYDVKNRNPGLYTAAECLIDSDVVPYPIRCQDGTYYCTGRFWTTLCGIDLQASWVNGHIREIARWSSYKLSKLFTEYVDHFWQQRQHYAVTGDRLREHFCKTMLNSLYGKFGQQSYTWKECEMPGDFWLWGQFPQKHAGTGEIKIIRSIAGYFQERVARGEHPNSFVAISAWITAYARQRIRELVQIAGSRNVYYVVSDALYVNRSGLINLQLAGEVQGESMGKLRQKRYGKFAHFRAANQYVIGNEHVVAGVHKSAIKLGETIYREQEFQRIKDVIAAKPLREIRITVRTKTLAAKVKRCNVGDDGWTYPHKIMAYGPMALEAMRRKSERLSFAELGTLKGM